MQIKARLATKISEIIQDKGLTRTETARILGMTQPSLCEAASRGMSERKLIDCLTKLGHDVDIVVRDASRRRTAGKISVVFAESVQ